MEAKERRDFYEKLYFHEIEVRGKVEARLQVPLTLFAIVFAMFGYLGNDVIVLEKHPMNEFFWIPFGFSVLSFIVSVFFFVLAWHWSTRYRLLATAAKLEEYYHQTLEKYIKDDPAKARQWTKEAYSEYMLNTLKSCATANSVTNVKRAFFIYCCNTALLFSAVLAVFCFYPYYDAIHQANQEIVEMTERPAPPPPPPERDVRGQPIPTPKPR